METLEQPTQGAADLHWLATLLTGCSEIAIDVTRQAIAIGAVTRRLLIAKALTAVREDLAASARRTGLRRTDRSALPPRSWALAEDTTKSDLERALLSIDMFPRAAVLLLVFEAVPLKDAAILLAAHPALVRKAQLAGVRKLTINLARMQGWKSAATTSRRE